MSVPPQSYEEIKLADTEAYALNFPCHSIFAYDAAGRLVSDGTRGITDILYNDWSEIPTMITAGGFRVHAEVTPDGRMFTEQIFCRVNVNRALRRSLASKFLRTERESFDVPEREPYDVPERETYGVPEREPYGVPEREPYDVPERERDPQKKCGGRWGRAVAGGGGEMFISL